MECRILCCAEYLFSQLFLMLCVPVTVIHFHVLCVECVNEANPLIFFFTVMHHQVQSEHEVVKGGFIFVYSCGLSFKEPFGFTRTRQKYPES